MDSPPDSSLLPDQRTAERIQIWGLFSIVDESGATAPKYGYLYFSAQSKDSATLHEWANLRAEAGTGEIVGFYFRGSGLGWPENPGIHDVQERARVAQRFIFQGRE